MNQFSIPYGKQEITKEDEQAVIESLHHPFLTQGPKIKEFEDNFADYVDTKYAVAVSNGTAALHLCALTLGVKKEQKVITTPITFAASANCVRYCGAEVVFADIDPETYLIDYESVKLLLEASPQGTYAGIIPVDFAGRAVDLENFKQLADDHGVWMIEDACHAPGGFFSDSNGNNQKCGNGQFADLAIFSFHPVKHIACGEGGMITTNDKDLYEQLLVLRTHGIVKDVGGGSYVNSIEFSGGKDEYPLWYMEMQELGYNYRITDIQCALGLSQLQRANQGIRKRRIIAEKYYNAFKNESFILGQSGVIEGHAYHLYVLEVRDRLGLYDYLRGHGIYAQIHYVPCHLMPYYRKYGWREGDMPHAENYYKHCISLPMFPQLTAEEHNYIIETVKAYYE